MIHNVLPPVVDQHTRVLIVGSMPGVQSLDKQQYYGNPRNHFWAIIAGTVQCNVPESYEDQLQLVQEYRIGLWDVIQSCEREGSLDSNIKREIPNDFHTLFKQYPQIEAVIFNGSKAYDVFRKKIGFSLLDERTYYKLPSTSPVPGRHIKTFEQKLSIWQEVLLPFVSS